MRILLATLAAVSLVATATPALAREPGPYEVKQVDASQALPKGVKETHVSLFDGSNCGIELEGKPVFSVQYHPEASPGPQDSHYLFERFAKLMSKKKTKAA